MCFVTIFFLKLLLLSLSVIMKYFPDPLDVIMNHLYLPHVCMYTKYELRRLNLNVKFN